MLGSAFLLSFGYFLVISTIKVWSPVIYHLLDTMGITAF